MELELTPEPRREEREAIDVALRKLLSRDSLPPAHTSAWWKAGLPAADGTQALARPRKSRGATRA
jgi:hypothetical protein